jgi:DNA-binding NarL/FixJ family response regulator
MPYEFTAFAGTANERVLVKVERESDDFDERERATIELLVPHVLDALRQVEQQSAGPAARAGSLTRRQIEVLERVAMGATNAAIAESLGISPRTVQTHLLRTFEKLGTRSRAAAVAVLLRQAPANELVE